MLGTLFVASCFSAACRDRQKKKKTCEIKIVLRDWHTRLLHIRLSSIELFTVLLYANVGSRGLQFHFNRNKIRRQN